MLHPIDYRLSKNKFWLSTWNSYSLKNYKNLILNDKILNILGYIFKNCFKVSYSFASPWSNPRKYRKYFSNFIIGFDGRRAIRTGLNKVKKLPGFIIPEDYNIIRFNNFSILKIYFLIDKNLETYWTKKQKNWRTPLKYFNMRYNKNRNSEENLLKLNKNLINNNIEKKNFKITSFFIYLINLLNNNSVKQHFYLDVSEQINFFKKDKKHLYFKFYYDNFKLLNKIRNNYFLFYLLNKNNSSTLSKLGLSSIKNNKKSLDFNSFSNFYLNNLDDNYKINTNFIKQNVASQINYKNLFKYNNFYNLNKKSNFLNFYNNLLTNSKVKINSKILIEKNNFFNNLKKLILLNKIKNHKGNYKNFFINSIIKAKKINSLNSSYIKNSLTSNYTNFHLNTNKKFTVGLFFQSFNSLNLKYNKSIFLNYKNKKNLLSNNLINNNFKKDKVYNKNWELQLLNKRLKSIYSVFNKQKYNNYKYFLKFLKTKNKRKKDLSSFSKIKIFNKSLKLKNFNKNLMALSYLQNFSYSYLFKNWLNFSNILFLNNKFKRTKKNKIYRYKKLNLNNKMYRFNKSIYNNIFKNLTKNKKLFLIKNNVYSYLYTNDFNEKNISLNKRVSFNNNNKNLFFNKITWGKFFWSITNFNKKKNYNYYLKNYEESDSRFLTRNILNKLFEYNSFLQIKNFNNKGFNSYSNQNFNFTNNILYNYIKLNKSNFFLSSINNNNISEFRNNNTLLSNNIKLFKNSISDKHVNNLSKNFKISELFNLYYKKTFSKFLNKQETFNKENLNRINSRLESLNKNKLFKLQKFKPYSFKSISKFYRYKLNKVILTNYLVSNNKKKYILNFLDLMENKKYKFNKGLSNNNNKFKAKNTILLNNSSITKFDELNIFNYSIDPFNKQLKALLFFNKKIKSKDTSLLLSKYKTKNFLVNYINLINFKNIHQSYLEKLKFSYFKSQQKFKITSSKNFLYIRPFKSLLYNNFYSTINNNNNKNNFLLNFKTRALTNRINYSSKKMKNVYKYKLNIYNYLKVNQRIELKQIYLPLNFKNKKILTIAPLIFKKSSLLNNKKFIYNKSNNLGINKYMKSRLLNIFLSKKSILKITNSTKLKSENFNYRLYGLVKKLSDVKPLYKKDFKKINELQPKTFLYWKHLKWFNLFIKTKFNFKFNNFHNSYSIFKSYENFKNLNFYHYKNYKKSYNTMYYNSFSSFKYDYQKLNNLIFYSTIFKSKKNYLSTPYLNKTFNKNFLLLNWTHDIMFSSSSSKRLNYIPHLRFKPIKDSIFMWRVNLRKLNLLSKYYKARTKYYKKKLNFASNYTTRTNIISYLKVMESNFNRIKKSMHRELPLIYIKRHLSNQFKKLNSYIKVLLRRQKKRFNYGFKRKVKFITNKNNNNLVVKENEILSKKLFNFVNKRFFFGKKNFIDYVKKFIEHLFLVIFKFNNLRLFYIKKYQINIMSTKAKLFKNLFNYRLATGFKIPFLVKVICKKLNFDKSLVGCKIGFFGRYSKKLRNRKIWKYVKHLKPSVISTPLDYYNILILQKWGITGIKLSMLKKKTFNFIFT